MPAPSAAPTAVASATFTVPADVVWAYRLDFANLPEYNPDVSGLERVADGRNGRRGGVRGPGRATRFGLADPRRPGGRQPVELWAESRWSSRHWWRPACREAATPTRSSW